MESMEDAQLRVRLVHDKVGRGPMGTSTWALVPTPVLLLSTPDGLRGPSCIQEAPARSPARLQEAILILEKLLFT